MPHLADCLIRDLQEVALAQVRRRVRQIDYVTVKGSQQPMGLFTYDVSLERVPSPNQGNYIAYTAAALTRRDSLMSQVSGVGSVADGRSANAAELLDDDVISFSMSAYNWEYSDHPDLACTWAVDEAFLGLFAQVSLVISSAVTGRPASSYPLGVLLEYLSQLCREPSMPVLWQQGGLQLLWQYIRILHCRASQHTERDRGCKQSRSWSRQSSCAEHCSGNPCRMAQATHCSTSWQGMITWRPSHGKDTES